MENTRSNRKKVLDARTDSFVSNFSDRKYDILLREAEFQTEYNPDIMLIDLEKRFIEILDIFNFPEDLVVERSYEDLTKDLKNFDEDISYILNTTGYRSNTLVEEPPKMKGDFYFNEEDAWKIETTYFENFVNSILEYDPIEDGSRIEYS